MKEFLIQEDKRKKKDRERQKSLEYKSRQKELEERKKKENLEKEKLSKKRKHTYKEEEKQQGTKKPRKETNAFVIGESVYHEFNIEGETEKVWYRGDVVRVHETLSRNNEKKYHFDVLFDDAWGIGLD